jgi:hypothetical protein
MEGVSASIHAPAHVRKTAHCDDGSEDDNEGSDYETEAGAKRRRKDIIAKTAEDTAPQPPVPDTRMGSSPIKAKPKKLPRAKTRVIMTTGGGRIMGRPNDPHVISSQDPDPIMQAR